MLNVTVEEIFFIELCYKAKYFYRDSVWNTTFTLKKSKKKVLWDFLTCYYDYINL